jgi:signal transduction histidine kinase
LRSFGIMTVPAAAATLSGRGGRLDQCGAGAGLGLAIVTDILDAWGGAIALGPRTRVR